MTNASIWGEEEPALTSIIQDVCNDFSAIEEHILTKAEEELIHYFFQGGREFFYSLVKRIIVDFSHLPEQNPYVDFTSESFNSCKQAYRTRFSYQIERSLTSLETKLIDYGFDAGYYHSVKSFQAVTDAIIDPPQKS